MTTSIVVDHLCRIEGHGGITVEVKNGKATRVQMDILEGTRFFEALIKGRNYTEVPGIVSRICSICSGVHTIASQLAVEDAFGVQVSRQTKLLRDLFLQGGNIESHALHVFCLALPDYLGYSGAIAMAADHPDKVKMGLELKKIGNVIQEVVGGRAVHPVNTVVGGFGKVPSAQELAALREKLISGLALAEKAVDFMATLEAPRFTESPTVYAALRPADGSFSLLGEEICLSTGESFPIRDYRKVCNEFVVPHSHSKHSKFDGRPFMVGALARLMINGKALRGKAREAAERLGLTSFTENIFHNNTAQVVELVYSLEHSIALIDELLRDGLQAEKPAAVKVKAGHGTGAAEAPRGILYHSYRFDERGRLEWADVIAPTSQNAANIEKDMRVAVERLAGEPKEVLAHKLEMVARAYDPCLSCSVHLVDLTNG
ncbi:MAG: Ni/Fe hydrogenase subunit alpha [candidate division KSB1 bacterium]|nr:Ni/Fe hydrogenase subunit alpha [candidate division KSB1 bacterium]MDZ7393537.1 Ni/Fe hydrogenase subunit alpha [candidate division KSB1 bacterium]